MDVRYSQPFGGGLTAKKKCAAAAPLREGAAAGVGLFPTPTRALRGNCCQKLRRVYNVVVVTRI